MPIPSIRCCTHLLRRAVTCPHQPRCPLPSPRCAALRSVQRSKSSTLARLTRTVSKLGSSRSSKARQAAAAAAAREAGGPAGGPGRVSSTEALQRAATLPSHHRMGSGGGVVAAGSRVQDAAAATAARIRQFEEGRFDLQRDLGSLTGGVVCRRAVVLCWTQAALLGLALVLPGWWTTCCCPGSCVRH